MTGGEAGPGEPREREPPDPPEGGPSWGLVSDRHWSRARAGANQEAIEHLRRRSQAPGVAEGGGARNHYCLECKGVIPFARPPPERCPHCGAALDEHVRAMFNWVEIDETPKGDAASLARLALIGLAVLAVAAAAAFWVLR
jgi:hypothetical protein